MLKRIVIAILLLAAITGASWYYWYATYHQPTNPRTTSPQSAQPVSMMTLTPQTIVLTQSLPGRVSAFRQSQVRPQVNGIIIGQLFEEGTTVQQGQQLYQIDDTRHRAALASAEADLKSAEARVKTLEARERRYQNLVQSDAISRQDYDDVKAQLDQARADIAVAQAAIATSQVNLDYTKVYAPISGQIGRSFITEGALVTANQQQPLAIITQLNPVYIDIQQSGVMAIEARKQITELPNISVRIYLNENQGSLYNHIGQLKFSEVTVDESTGSVTLRAVIPNPDGILLPGLFVRAVLDFGTKENVLLVPQRATIRNPDGSLRVWVIHDDHSVESRSIQISGAHESHWVVTEGLQANEKIVVEGYQKIGPGTKVSPSPWIEPDSGYSDQMNKPQG